MNVRYERAAFESLSHLQRTSRFWSVAENELERFEARPRLGDLRRGRPQADGTLLAVFNSVLVSFGRSPEDADTVIIYDIRPGSLGGPRQ